MVTVDYRVNGGPVCEAYAQSEPRTQGVNARVFQAVLPASSHGLIEFLPVLRLAGQTISPRLQEASVSLHYAVSRVVVPPGVSVPSSRLVAPAACHGESVSASPNAPREDNMRWAWDTKFLGALTVTLRKEVVGPTPDGLRMGWYVTAGTFVGPGFAAVVRPGAADWMRIRQDGVGVVNVTACLETRLGVRIYAAYGGFLDLGSDGYARALRNEFDPLPPLVVTPTYATADKRLEWLNRAQCIGVGRVDMKALRVEFDAYVVRVGGRTSER